MLPQLENISKVAAALRPIRERFVFAGAGILPLFLDRNFGGVPRPTVDTDVVVPVVHYSEWSRLRDVLVAHGFLEYADDRKPRQILFRLGDLEVDFIPARMVEFGTANRWLSLGFDLAEPDVLKSGVTISRLPITAWLASKIAAFEQRGRQDALVSRDLDDIVTLLLGRANVVTDVRDAVPEIRVYIGAAFQAWQEQPLIWDAMDGCVRSANERLRLDTVRSQLAST